MNENRQHPGEDGAVYEVDLVIHDKNTSFEYDVDLVRWTEDEHGLPNAQRLTLETHDSYGLAEEHQMGVDQAISELGLENAIGKEVEQVKAQPFEDIGYVVTVSSEDFNHESPASLELLAIQEGRFDTVVLAEGNVKAMEHLAMSLEDVQSEHGDVKLIEAARDVAIDQGMMEPDQPLFQTQPLPEIDNTVNYGVVAFDEEVSASLPATVALIAEQGENSEIVTLASGTWEEMERIFDTLETIQSEQGDAKFLETARDVAVEQGLLEPNQPLLSPQFLPEPALDTVENPYWQFETLPVEAPDGESLGVSLNMVRFPTIEQPEDRSQLPDIPADAPVEMVEFAQFETRQQADTFAEDFNSFLSPGLLEGPELVEAVLSKFEDEPVAWKPLDEVEREALQNNTMTLTYDRSDWSPHEGAVAVEPPTMAPDFDL